MKLELELHSPLTKSQQLILRSRKEHLFIHGPAGTAKSYTALARGLIKLAGGHVERILVVRSPVEIRKIGHLPGDQDEKVGPYAAPFVGLIDEISPKMNYKTMVSKKLISFEPTTFLRGRTFHDTYILVDEFQNMSSHELETIVTRVGRNSQLVIVGDTDGQSDLPRHEQDDWRTVADALGLMESMDTIVFSIDEIVRSGFVKEYYIAKQAASRGAQLPEQMFRKRSPLTAVA